MTAPPPRADMTPQSKTVSVLGWVAVAILGALVVAFGWDRGPDPLIDFGRELYVPWRLTEGDVLHRDIAWFNGPLGPWAIEGWMGVFGVSADVVQAMNTVVIAITAATIARVCLVIANLLTAWVAVIAFLLVFAVAQQEGVGNFLFLAPYSHGITIGFVCGLSALVSLHQFGEEATRRAAFEAGSLLGLAFLTKAEIFLGSALGAGAMVAGLLVSPTEAARGQGGRLLTWLAVGFVATVGLAGARFAAQLGVAEVPQALAGTWIHAFDPSISDGPFYKAMRGTDDVTRSLVRVLATTAGIAIFVGAVTAGARFVSRLVPNERLAAAIAFGAASALTIAAFTQAHLRWMLLPLVLFLPVLAVLRGVDMLRSRGAGLDPRRLLLLGFAAFAVGLLPKILLAPMARQYGFVLTLPGTVLLVCLLVKWVPDAWARLGARASTVAAAGTGIVLVFAVMNFHATSNWFARKQGALGYGKDRVIGERWLTDPMSVAGIEIAPLVDEDESLLVLPEGIMLNYQLRRRTPTRLVNFMPPELSMFEQSEVIESLEADPPAVVVLLQRPTDIYGYPFMGEGYGEEILAWVRSRYERLTLIGNDPFTPGWGNFGAEILLPR